MKLFYVPLLLSTALLLSSCGQHHITGHGATKSSSIALSGGDFDRVEIEAPVEARIRVGESQALRLEGYENILPHIRAEVKNRTLRIYADEITDLHTDKNVIAYITLPTLTALDLSGSSDAKVRGPLRTNDFVLDASGATEVDIEELYVGSFDADMSGSSSLTLHNGEIGNGAYDVSGSGEIYAFGVTQQNAMLDLSGAAEAEVNVTNKLDVEISGAGTVLYKGRPTISQDISGAGSVKAAN